MDYDSSVNFLSSLAKFLQSLCNGYIQFDNGVQINGHLYISIDTNKTIDYVLNEKVLKNNEECVTFTSDSFYAQPAQPPKKASPGKRNSISKSKTVCDDSDSSSRKTNKINDPGLEEFSGDLRPVSSTNPSSLCHKLPNETLIDQKADSVVFSKCEEYVRTSLNPSSSISFGESTCSSLNHGKREKPLHSQSFQVLPSLEDSFPSVTFQSDSSIKNCSPVHIKKEPLTEENFVSKSDASFGQIVKQELKPTHDLQTNFSDCKGYPQNSLNYLKDGSKYTALKRTKARKQTKVKDPERARQCKASLRKKREYNPHPKTEQEIRENARLRKQKSRARQAERRKQLGFFDSDTHSPSKSRKGGKTSRFEKLANVKEMQQWHNYQENMKEHYLRQQAYNGDTYLSDYRAETDVNQPYLAIRDDLLLANLTELTTVEQDLSKQRHHSTEAQEQTLPQTIPYLY